MLVIYVMMCMAALIYLAYMRLFTTLLVAYYIMYIMNYTV